MSVHTVDVRRVQRRTMSLLLVIQVLGSTAVTMTFAVSGILAAELSGSTGAAGLAQATLTLGVGAASYLLAAWMNRRGRRVGMAAGYLIGAVGAAVCVVAAEVGSFPLLVAGTVALGASAASSNAARYVATDLATADRRATSLSLVVWVATAGAVAGPLMVDQAEAVASGFGLPPLAGPFLFTMMCALVAGLVVFAFLRPDPLLLARATLRSRTAPEESEAEPAGPVSRFAEVAPTVAALVLAHATMVAVMVMTPLEMHHQGATHATIGAAISVHFLGMYAFSPLSGRLADRIGVRPSLTAGGGLLIVSVLVSAGLFGASSFTHGLGLFLLGLGWSVCTVAASTHIAALSAGDTRLQGGADTAMTVVSAGAALAAGPIMAVWGFAGLLAMAAVFSAGVVVAARRTQGSRRPWSVGRRR
ncbi:MFS transporter [Jiangella alba]|uniref:Predicted arabinose efflux permease, MFS family n=1 Tax=Jiangella alba TaxID=561176 RepID=A0A1H5PY73_9ACTN|nr:MFS transporter [Jiangella alba]SEF18756.1 Predicted arabinose efflux permease, MFS family [Jiangella alba]